MTSSARDGLRSAAALANFSEPADALAVHGQLGGACGRNHFGHALGLERGERVGGDGLDLRHDQMRALLLDQRAQRRGIAHVDHVRAMRDLVPRRIRVAVHGDHFDAEPLQRNDHFLAEFARAEQHHARGGGGKRGTEPLADLHVFFR